VEKMAQTENSVTAYDVEDWKNKGRIQMSPAERESWLNEGQLLLTDYAEGIEREWELIKFYGQLLAAVADWCIVFLKGAHGPKWTDGQELNYKRRRIEYQQEEMIAHGFFIPSEFADLPPEMDVNYMRGRENIKKNAKEIFEFFDNRNVQIRVISGDNPITVSSIAKQAGIKGYEKYIDCRELRELCRYTKSSKKIYCFW